VGGALDNTAIPDCNPWTIATRHADTGVIVVCEQKIALGRANAGQTLAIAVSGTTLAIELDDDENSRDVRRTTTVPCKTSKPTARGRAARSCALPLTRRSPAC
jgi:hypothetical protein